MQATSVTRQSIDRISTYLIGIGVMIAIVLFLVVISRVGIFSDLIRPKVTAQSADLIVTAQQMRFGQEEIRLQVGETVAIVLDNQDLFGHSFDADDFDLHVAMPANQEVLATFTATRPGVYEFYCGVPGHTEAGMVGKIIVAR